MLEDNNSVRLENSKQKEVGKAVLTSITGSVFKLH